MSKARILAILAFITLGSAGGSLIVGDAAWFAWTASTGAVLLIAWARATRVTEDTPPRFPRIDPPYARVIDRPAPISLTEVAYSLPRGRTVIPGGQEPPWVPGLNCDLGERFPSPWPGDDDRRPVWTTDVFGAPE